LNLAKAIDWLKKNTPQQPGIFS
jgi:hypothetical protein